MTGKTESRTPVHLAIIMDGNGRWASKRGLPRSAGHKAGITALRNTVANSAARNISHLTVYAFSSENWNRPKSEVRLLLELFIVALEEEVNSLNENDVKLNFIGDLSAFPENLTDSISNAMQTTASNRGLNLNIAANYGGRWELARLCNEISGATLAGKIEPELIDENLIKKYTCLPDSPDPDLFIRTGGERRISNFLLWQLAYTELYFTDIFWPDFNEDELDKALAWYSKRERKFGRLEHEVC